MKKIIELAEKATGDNKDMLSAFASYQALKDALAKRKQLEQTPITEEWLKGHGWKRNNRNLWWKACNGGMGIFTLFIRVSTYNKWYWFVNGNDYLCLTSIADLLDACELCGIKLDI